MHSANCCPVLSLTTKAVSISSTDRGGGKRRSGIGGDHNPRFGGGQQTAMQDDDLFAERPPDDQQWFDQYGQVGKVIDQFLDAAFKFGRSL
jgi:hypothetical protein